MTDAVRDRFVGIDPGRSKCGFAVEFADGGAPVVEVVPTADIEARIDREVRSGGVVALCVGDATTSEHVVRLCAAACPAIPLHVVDERNSTLLARQLYYEDHPPRGLMRLIPRGLLVPSEPLDDYAALIIIRRFRRHVESGENAENRARPPGSPAKVRGQEWPAAGKEEASGVHPAEGFVPRRPG